MAEEITVKKIMDDIFDYPHLPYWFSIRQAMGIIKSLLPESGLCLYPRVVLIFDEKYNLLGSLAVKDILKGIEPKLSNSTPETASIDVNSMPDDFWQSMYGTFSKEFVERPVSDIMMPATVFLDPDDSISKAAYMMVKNDRICLPVLEGKKKLVGVVKMAKVFDELSSILMQS